MNTTKHNWNLRSPDFKAQMDALSDVQDFKAYMKRQDNPMQQVGLQMMVKPPEQLVIKPMRADAQFHQYKLMQPNDRFNGNQAPLPFISAQGLQITGLNNLHTEKKAPQRKTLDCKPIVFSSQVPVSNPPKGKPKEVKINVEQTNKSIPVTLNGRQIL